MWPCPSACSGGSFVGRPHASFALVPGRGRGPAGIYRDRRRKQGRRTRSRARRPTRPSCRRQRVRHREHRVGRDRDAAVLQHCRRLRARVSGPGLLEPGLTCIRNLRSNSAGLACAARGGGRAGGRGCRRGDSKTAAVSSKKHTKELRPQTGRRHDGRRAALDRAGGATRGCVASRSSAASSGVGACRAAADAREALLASRRRWREAVAAAGRPASWASRRCSPRARARGRSAQPSRADWRAPAPGSRPRPRARRSAPGIAGDGHERAHGARRPAGGSPASWAAASGGRVDGRFGGLGGRARGRGSRDALERRAPSSGARPAAARRRPAADAGEALERAAAASRLAARRARMRSATRRASLPAAPAGARRRPAAARRAREALERARRRRGIARSMARLSSRRATCRSSAPASAQPRAREGWSARAAAARRGARGCGRRRRALELPRDPAELGAGPAAARARGRRSTRALRAARAPPAPRARRARASSASSAASRASSCGAGPRGRAQRPAVLLARRSSVEARRASRRTRAPGLFQPGPRSPPPRRLGTAAAARTRDCAA